MLLSHSLASSSPPPAPPRRCTGPRPLYTLVLPSGSPLQGALLRTLAVGALAGSRHFSGRHPMRAALRPYSAAQLGLLHLFMPPYTHIAVGVHACTPSSLLHLPCRIPRPPGLARSLLARPGSWLSAGPLSRRQCLPPALPACPPRSPPPSPRPRPIAVCPPWLLAQRWLVLAGIRPAFSPPLACPPCLPCTSPHPPHCPIAVGGCSAPSTPHRRPLPAPPWPVILLY
ncbi:hypothetical protein B0H11DRAFT_2253102 [Mycena galericulata]|nr:hypothetical protein B0H11DRAFT_2253102 [Mycena galericulata]